MTVTKAMFTSKSGEWETPSTLFRKLNDEFHFSLDVCATATNRKVATHFSKKHDGLAHSWGIQRCWMNPPYGDEIVKWMEKAVKENESGALVVALVPARTDTEWWHEYAMHASEIRLIAGRIKFVGAKHSATFPSAIVVFYPPFDNPYKLAVPILKAYKLTPKERGL